MKIDLHMHSSYSPDGSHSIDQLVDLAAKKGLDVIALSDHDLISGVQEMTAKAAQKGIEVIPALECTTLFDEHNVHTLGYGIDIHHPYFENLACEIEEKNKDVFSIRIQKLTDKYGIQVNEQEIIEKANGKNPWFTLIDEILTDPIIQAHPDFQDYLPGGKRCDPAPVNFFWDRCQPGSDLYVEAWFPDFFETIDKIHEAGGVAVIAHPFNTFYKNEALLQRAMDHGVDGLEAYSNYHTPEQNEWYHQFAQKNGLLYTCGSDFHGEKKPSIEMGDYGVMLDGREAYEALKAAIETRRQSTH